MNIPAAGDGGSEARGGNPPDPAARPPGPASASGEVLRAFPAFFESRGLPRVSRQELGLVEMQVKPKGSGTWIPARLWDFSPISFGFTAPHDSASGIQEGDTLNVQLRLDRKAMAETECWVRAVESGPAGFKAGVLRLDVDDFSALLGGQDSAPAPRSANTTLTARINHPWLYGHSSPLRLLRGLGGLDAEMASDDPCLLLFPGREIEVRFDLPELQDTPLNARVETLRCAAGGGLESRLRGLSAPRRLKAALIPLLRL